MKKLIFGGAVVLLVLMILMVGCGQKSDMELELKKAEIKTLYFEETTDVYYYVSDDGHWYIKTDSEASFVSFMEISVDEYGKADSVRLRLRGADFSDNNELHAYRTKDDYKGEIRVNVRLDFSKVPVSYPLQSSIMDIFDEMPKTFEMPSYLAKDLLKEADYILSQLR